MILQYIWCRHFFSSSAAENACTGHTSETPIDRFSEGSIEFLLLQLIDKPRSTNGCIARRHPQVFETTPVLNQGKFLHSSFVFSNDYFRRASNCLISMHWISQLATIRLLSIRQKAVKNPHSSRILCPRLEEAAMCNYHLIIIVMPKDNGQYLQDSRFIRAGPANVLV